MSILNKITPGPWKLHLLRWGKNGPPEGFTITASSIDSDGKSREIATLNATSNTRVYYGDSFKPSREYYLDVDEFNANIKSIAHVPDMLSIIERLGNIKRPPNDEFIRQIDLLQVKVAELLNKLNS